MCAYVCGELKNVVALGAGEMFVYVCRCVCMCTYIHMSGTKWNYTYVCRCVYRCVCMYAGERGVEERCG